MFNFTEVKQEEIKYNVPKTGDNIYTYIAMILLSIVGLIATGVRSRKKKNI